MGTPPLATTVLLHEKKEIAEHLLGDPSFGEEEEEEDATGYDKETNNNMMVMSDILFQVSSLCDANFIIKSGSCRLEGCEKPQLSTVQVLVQEIIS
ncbi:hypothetical protein Bca52824_077514 [Brassica carinata]|uniref:Uncharacterized protein n=1 Tax=Brassica carinata TaxID=52824 RepID=A0A8X7PW16_BRACI|nr:hypothetical protein Bca52824_077514 [Brassica carinata]